METVTVTWSKFPNGSKTTVKQILASKEMNKPKRAELWQWQSGIQVGKLTIWRRLFEMDVSMSPKTNTLADRFIERTSSMLDEIKSKTVHKDKEGDQ